MALAVSRRPVTAEARVRFQVSIREVCGGQSGTGTGFSPSTWIFPFQYHSTNGPYSSSCTGCCYQKDKRATPGNVPKGHDFSENGERWIEHNFQFFILQRISKQDIAVIIWRYTFRYKPFCETVKSKGKCTWSLVLIKDCALKAYSGLKVCVHTFLRSALD
jgi:hypothetical protein